MPTLLVAEDNTGDVFLLTRAFAKAGGKLAVHYVRDGQEATEYLNGEGCYSDRHTYPFPDLVLTDIKMPRVDGFGVLTWVRDQPLMHRLPTVVFSSSFEPEDVSKAYDFGANSFLAKPMDFDDWVRIATALEGFWFGTAVLPKVEAA
jgi:CheY-like chemotaxis protein